MLKLQSGKDDYVGFVAYNPWNTAEETRNKHSSVFLTRKETEVDHILPGETQSGQTSNL